VQAKAVVMETAAGEERAGVWGGTREPGDWNFPSFG
jgi:hypothetical protein